MVFQRSPDGSILRAVAPLLVLLAGTSALSACATSPNPQQAGRRSSAAIDSHRSTGFDGTVTRLVVLLGRSDHPADDQVFRTFIQQELAKRRVAAVVATVSPATIDGPQPLQSAELADQRRTLRVLSPQAVLRIRSPRVVPDALHPQWRIQMIYEVGLHLVASAEVGERIWRAELEHTGPERTMDKRFMLAAACLMERLDTDGLLAPDSGP